MINPTDNRHRVDAHFISPGGLARSKRRQRTQISLTNVEESFMTIAFKHSRGESQRELRRAKRKQHNAPIIIAIINQRLFLRKVKDVALKLTNNNGVYTGHVIIYTNSGQELAYSGQHRAQYYMEEYGFAITERQD